MSTQVRWMSHQITLLSMFESLQSNQAFVDVTLACEGKFIRCHQIVLAACSSYFQELLSLEKKKHPIVYLKDVKYSHMLALVDHMYRGEFNICHEELSGLMAVAESLKIRGINEALTYQNVLPCSTSTKLPHSDLLTHPSVPVTHCTTPTSVFQSHPGDLVTPPSYQPSFGIETQLSSLQSGISEEQNLSVPLTTFYNELLHNSEMQELLAGRITECLDSTTPRDQAEVAKAVSSVAEKEIDNFFSDFFSIDFDETNTHHENNTLVEGEVINEEDSFKVEVSGSLSASSAIETLGDSHQQDVITKSFSVTAPTPTVPLKTSPSTIEMSNSTALRNNRTVITVIDDEFRKLKREQGLTHEQNSNNSNNLSVSKPTVVSPELKARPITKRRKTNYKRVRMLQVVPSNPLQSFLHPWRKLGRRSINPKFSASELSNPTTVIKLPQAIDDLSLITPRLISPITLPYVSSSPVSNSTITTTTMPSPSIQTDHTLTNTPEVLPLPPKEIRPHVGSSGKVVFSFLRSAKKIDDSKPIPKLFESLKKPKTQDNINFMKKKSFSTPRKKNNHVRNLQFKTPPSLREDSLNDEKLFYSGQKRKLNVFFDEKQSKKRLDWSLGPNFEPKLNKIQELDEQNNSSVSSSSFNFPRSNSPVPVQRIKNWNPPPTPRLISQDEHVPGWYSPAVLEKRSPETLLRLTRFMSPLLPGTIPRTPGHSPPVSSETSRLLPNIYSPIGKSTNERPPKTIDTEINTPNPKSCIHSIALAFTEPLPVRNKPTEPLPRNVEIPNSSMPNPAESVTGNLNLPPVNVGNEQPSNEVEIGALGIIGSVVAQKPVKSVGKQQGKLEKTKPLLPAVPMATVHNLNTKDSSSEVSKPVRRLASKSKQRANVAESTRVLRSQSKTSDAIPIARSSATATELLLPTPKSSSSKVDLASPTNKSPTFPIMAYQKSSLPFPKTGLGFRSVKNHSPVVNFLVGGKIKCLSVSRRTTFSPLFHEFERRLGIENPENQQSKSNPVLVHENSILCNLLSQGTERPKAKSEDTSNLTFNFKEHLGQLFSRRQFHHS